MHKNSKPKLVRIDTDNRKQKHVKIIKRKEEMKNIKEKHLDNQLKEFINLKQTMSKLLVKEGVYVP
jgi:flagellar motility protein MotE (MotC chaperone)